MTETHWIDRIARLNACDSAMGWLHTQPDAATAWRTCDRGDWMLWLLGRQSGAPESDARKHLVLAACGCARLALPQFETRYPNDPRVRACLDTAEQWARGEATIADAAAAWAAADAAAAATYAATDATDAAAAAATYAAAARAPVLRECADVVRTFYPDAPVDGEGG